MQSRRAVGADLDSCAGLGFTRSRTLWACIGCIFIWFDITQWVSPARTSVNGCPRSAVRDKQPDCRISNTTCASSIFLYSYFTQSQLRCMHFSSSTQSNFGNTRDIAFQMRLNMMLPLLHPVSHPWLSNSRVLLLAVSLPTWVMLCPLLLLQQSNRHFLGYCFWPIGVRRQTQHLAPACAWWHVCSSTRGFILISLGFFIHVLFLHRPSGVPPWQMWCRCFCARPCRSCPMHQQIGVLCNWL